MSVAQIDFCLFTLIATAASCFTIALLAVSRLALQSILRGRARNCEHLKKHRSGLFVRLSSAGLFAAIACSFPIILFWMKLEEQMSPGSVKMFVLFAIGCIVGTGVFLSSLWKYPTKTFLRQLAFSIVFNIGSISLQLSIACVLIGNPKGFEYFIIISTIWFCGSIGLPSAMLSAAFYLLASYLLLATKKAT